MARFWREMSSELKKVVWPTRKQIINNSIIVIVCVVIVGALTFVFDTLVGQAVKGLIALFKG